MIFFQILSHGTENLAQKTREWGVVVSSKERGSEKFENTDYLKNEEELGIQMCFSFFSLFCFPNKFRYHN